MSIAHIELPPTTGWNETLTPDPYDRYFHVTYGEEDAPDLAIEAWQIHAEGYSAMGFVHDGAVTPEGFLTDDIDKARGPNVEYHLAFHPENGTDKATMRKIHLAEGQTCQDLPAYQLCKDALYPLGRVLLAGFPTTRLKEIGALARTTNAHPLAVHEIFRKVIHSAIEKSPDGTDKNEVWFASIVSKTHDLLVGHYGAKNFTPLGEKVPIVDERVAESIELKPVLIRPDKFIANILASYNEAVEAADPKAMHSLRRSFIFFTDGLRPDQMSTEVADARQTMTRTNAKQGA